jgi:hypothetical protein
MVWVALVLYFFTFYHKTTLNQIICAIDENILRELYINIDFYLTKKLQR